MIFILDGPSGKWTRYCSGLQSPMRMAISSSDRFWLWLGISGSSPVLTDPDCRAVLIHHADSPRNQIKVSSALRIYRVLGNLVILIGWTSSPPRHSTTGFPWNVLHRNYNYSWSEDNHAREAGIVIFSSGELWKWNVSSCHNCKLVASSNERLKQASYDVFLGLYWPDAFILPSKCHYG